MKKLALMITISVALMSFVITPSAGTFKIDTKASQLKWTGYHLAKSYEHTGFISLKSGNLKINGEKIEGEFVIDMNSIIDVDLTDEKNNAKFVGHLKSDDFFAVKEFPEAKLVIKGSEKTGENTYKTLASLTIRGITNPITFETTITKLTDNEIGATAVFNVNRTDFKVMYGWKIENAMLSSDFKMEVNLIGGK